MTTRWIDLDFGALNSATKYPSIPTYHALGERGRLTPDVQVDFGDEPVVVTEKINGTSGRIITLPDGDWFIGSREELLTARGDRVPNTGLRIVEALCRLAENLGHAAWERGGASVGVYFLEVYGHGTTRSSASRQYAAGTQVGCRLFDLAVVDRRWLDEPREKIAAARERVDGTLQEYADESDLVRLELEIARVPVLSGTPASPPCGVAETYEWLGQFRTSLAALSPRGAGRRSEGVVVRTRDRSKIAKIRFEDYERTLGARDGGQRDG